MSRRRWIADEVSGNQAALVGDHAHHLARVLRAQIGQGMDLIAGGVVRRGVITSVRDDRIEFELAEEVAASVLPDVSLLLAIFKFDRLEWAIEKCTELGVRRIVPVIARRTDTHLAAAASKRLERWQRLVQQASEQSRRVDVPEVSHPVKLKDAVHQAATLRLLLAEIEKQQSLHDALEANRTSQSLLLAVGPEGGWTEDEIALFTGQGWISTSLGETILRAETAAIAATAIAFSVLS
jgi:16S rRNA (uracil1498-N3)-methyltransferase